MFCQKCGAEMAEGAKFCTRCGTKAVQVSPPQMSASVPTGNGMQENVSGSNPFPGNPNVQPNQITYNGTVSNGRYYGDNIKPYYRAEFDKIALGQKTKFNWAAFFLGPYTQLYNGCAGIFCKTFLPLQIAVFAVGLIGIWGSLRLNFILLGITSLLNGLIGLGNIGLQVINGLQFNKWFYQDVIHHPEKKRSKKGLWIFIICQIMAVAVLYLAPIIFRPSYDDLFDDVSSYDLTDMEGQSQSPNVKPDIPDVEYDKETLEETPFGYERDAVEPTGNYTDYIEWGGDYDGGWLDTTLNFSLYSDGTQDPGCGYITTNFRGNETSGKLYYLGDNEFMWAAEYDSIETYYICAVYGDGTYQLELYNSDGMYEVTFTMFNQYIP